MATGIHNQDLVLGNQLRKQLAVAVRSIQWSYAIFWSISTNQQGVLEWGDGYYNGDIKTRKTMQPMELNVDKLGLKRSEQLKELYDCLAIGEITEQAKRPSASLSPEDLSDAEWYYLVCMSFTFSPGVGLPGRTFASGQHVWLYNAQYADSAVFTRSLLAKSASIQTVVCFPLLGGVIELGVTDLVMEDLNLLQHVKTIFLEFQKHFCSKKSISSPRKDDNVEELVCEVDHDVFHTMAFEKLNSVVECATQTEAEDQVFPFSIPPYTPRGDFEFDQNDFKNLQANVHEKLNADSTDDSSDESETNQQTEDSFMVEGGNDRLSQVQSWQLMDEDFGNCIPISMNSTDCISQTYFNPDKDVPPLKKESIKNDHILDFEEGNHTKFSSLDIGANDLHYTRTLSVILGNSSNLIAAPCSGNKNQKSSFLIWKKGSLIVPDKLPNCTPQKTLKKILFDVPLMYGDASIKSKTETRELHEHYVQEEADIGGTPFLSEIRDHLNDPFLILKTLVPSMNKLDKAAILGETIEYLRDLERRVEDLESRGRKKYPDIVERTSDNYCVSDDRNGKKPPMSKRKAADIDEIDPELYWDSSKEGLWKDVRVCIEEKEATIEMHVPWRECLLLDVMDAINNLQLDAHSVKSSTSDGIFSLTLKSKFRGAGLITAGMIKLAIQKVISKC